MSDVGSGIVQRAFEEIERLRSRESETILSGEMWWKNQNLAKGTAPIWSVMLSISLFLAAVWGIAMSIDDPIWRWSVAVIGTIVCLGSPGGLATIFWLSSSEYRKQHYLYRRGGPLPGYPADEPWQASVVREFLDKLTSEALDQSILRSHSVEFQKNLTQEMHESVSEILRAENSLLKCREKLAAYVVGYADWMVLCLKPEEKPHLQRQPGVRMSYVSGELHRHIRYCAQYNSDLARIIHENKDATDDLLVDWANARSMALLYLSMCINVVRVDVNDCKADVPPGHKADWFEPFKQSMLIWKEAEYRKRIGLPQLLPDGLVACHSTFLTGVLDGVSDPLSHWEMANGLKHSDVI